MIEQRARLLQDVLDKKRKIADLVEILWVSRQTLSKWKAQYVYWGINGLLPRKPWPKKGSFIWNKTQKSIEELVAQLAKKHWNMWPQLLSDTLDEEYNITLHPTTIWRILKRRWDRYMAGYRKLKKKKKLYVKDIPGRELQLDVSFPWWYQKKCHLYSAIDDCTRFVYSHVSLDHCETSTIVFLKKLIQDTPFVIQAIRTDQWREFSGKVTEFLKKHNIIHIKNPAYTPQYNGKIERFHRTYKEQARYRWSFAWDNETLSYHLQSYLHYYNYRKKHRWLGMNGLTPAQKLHQCFFEMENHWIIPENENVKLTLQQNNNWPKSIDGILMSCFNF